MPLLGAVIVPHPPLMIPTVGQGQERQVQATIDAYRAAARQVADWRPEVLAISSPHTIMYADYFHVSPGAGASGSMAAFGAPQTRLEVKYDTELRQEVVRHAGSRHFPTPLLSPGGRGELPHSTHWIVRFFPFTAL